MVGIGFALVVGTMLITDLQSGSVPKRNNSEQNILTIAQEISDYLAEHPKAADSLEGVASWWLTRQRYERAEDIVHKALEHLVAQGVVKKVNNKGNKTVYSYAVKNDKT